MQNFTQPKFYKWKTVEFPICRLTVSASDLADFLGLKIESWDIDGLGEASGFIAQSSTGLVIYAVELLHGVEHLGHRGPVIYIDALEVVINGVNKAIESTLAALSLTRERVDWVQPISAQETAKLLAGRCGERNNSEQARTTEANKFILKQKNIAIKYDV